MTEGTVQRIYRRGLKIMHGPWLTIPAFHIEDAEHCPCQHCIRPLGLKAESRVRYGADPNGIMTSIEVIE